jgi:multidrug efflux pump subunit AcrA (membrane-fusion protein)
MTVRAPVDGRVYRLVANPGTTLTGEMGSSDQYDGSTVVTMYRPEMLQARVDVRFEDVPQVALGQAVQIENPALKEPLVGKVLFISSLANIQKNTLEVKVAIESPPTVFRPEMLVNVTFLAPPSTEQPSGPTEQMRLYVPNQYVHRSESGVFVWLADQSAGVARRASVNAGPPASNGLAEITSGLTATSRVITTGAENLRDGERIQIVAEELEPAAAHSLSHQPAGGALNRLPQGESH